jgi:hypothetical protein
MIENLYSKRSSLAIGFHGCDKSVVKKVVQGEDFLNFSTNKYDWLGKGIYFWQNNPKRALEYAQESMKRKDSTIKEPAVVGAFIDLGHCLDLIDLECLQEVKQAYEALKAFNNKAGLPLPTNDDPEGSQDKLLRRLDCAVIETTHTLNNGLIESIENSIDTLTKLLNKLDLISSLHLQGEITDLHYFEIVLNLVGDVIKSMNDLFKKIITKDVNARCYRILISIKETSKALQSVHNSLKNNTQIEDNVIEIFTQTVRVLKNAISLFPEYDSVRGVFWEGGELYPTAGFSNKNHVQLCIRNPNCIKGFFLPRDLDDKYPNP